LRKYKNSLIPGVAVCNDNLMISLKTNMSRVLSPRLTVLQGWLNELYAEVEKCKTSASFKVIVLYRPTSLKWSIENKQAKFRTGTARL
jgi:hypothetical protein